MKNPYTLNSNTRITAQLVVNTGTRETTDGTKKVQTYQNIITAKNQSCQEELPE